MKNIATVLLARGGSKGLPGKNTKKLLGHPLLAYTVVPVKSSKYIQRVILSTDDPEIAAAAREYGAEVPFIRPKELAQDFTSSEDSVSHSLTWLQENEGYNVDILVYLQVTDLFKKVELIDRCIETLLKDDTLDSVFLAAPDKKNYWKAEGENYLSLTPGKHMSRQLKPPVFREDTGLGCATRASLLTEQRRRLGDKVKIIPHDLFLVDIHTEFDFWLAERLLQEREEYQQFRLERWL